MYSTTNKKSNRQDIYTQHFPAIQSEWAPITRNSILNCTCIHARAHEDCMLFPHCKPQHINHWHLLCKHNSYVPHTDHVAARHLHRGELMKNTHSVRMTQLSCHMSTKARLFTTPETEASKERRLKHHFVPLLLKAMQ